MCCSNHYKFKHKLCIYKWIYNDTYIILALIWLLIISFKDSLSLRAFFFNCKGQKWDLVSLNINSYSRESTALTDGNFFDELGGSMSPLHQGSCPRRQIPVGLHSEDVGLDAPSCACPSSKDQLGALRRRTPSTARMNQSGGETDHFIVFAESVLSLVLTSNIITF